MRYPLAVAATEHGFLKVGCPLLPEVEVSCRDEDDADLVAPARQAILSAFARRIATRTGIPLLSAGAAAGRLQEGPRRVAYSAPLPFGDDPELFVTFGALIALKIELHNAMVADGIRKASLARLLGVHPPIVDRLLDLAHASKLEQIEAALSAIGREVEVATRAA